MQEKSKDKSNLRQHRFSHTVKIVEEGFVPTGTGTDWYGQSNFLSSNSNIRFYIFVNFMGNSKRIFGLDFGVT